jgi:hypothetical protein
LIPNSTHEEELTTNFGGLEDQQILNKNSASSEATTMQIGQMESPPKEVHFTIAEIWPKFQQIGQQLGLKCSKKEWEHF